MSAAVHLKELRLAATPRLSIRQMADRLGIDHSTYVRYERPERFKKKHLPVELAQRIASVLADHSINPDDVMALAGVEGPSSVDALSMGEEHWVAIYRAMSQEQRRLLEQLAEQILGRKAAETLNQQQDSYRSTGAPHS